MANVNIRDLRHQIKIQDLNRSPDGQGGWNPVTRTDVVDGIWAKIEPRSAMQKWKADKLEHNISHVITIRNFTGITSQMIAVFEGRDLQIHGVYVIDEKRFFMELHCEEGEPS